MPELPEVETIRKDLSRLIINKKINKVQVSLERIVKPNAKIFSNILVNNKFTRIERVGKLLIFKLERGKKYLLVHLKMTGQLIYQKNKKIIAGGHSDNSEINKLPNKFTRVIFKFFDGGELFFNDVRTFGYLKIVEQKELEKIKSKFGIEPMTENFRFEDFEKIIKMRKTNIKAILLNQQLISGIGNIYADEILFSAKIRPNRIANTLNKKEIKNTFDATGKITKNAIKYRGTTFNNYLDANGNKGNYVKFLKVYQREGEKCEKCRSIIKKTKVAGRGTRYCPKCQE